MKQFNLLNEIIVVDKKRLLNALEKQKEFAINIKGEVLSPAFTEREILIYQGEAKQGTISEILGKNYQVVEDDDRVLIKAFANWQEIIKLNIPHASYDDTTGDGVDRFSDESIETIGWNATEFDITYRELVEVLEENVEGTLLCVEREEPYHFSGLGFIQDNAQAQETLFQYSQEKIKEMLKSNPLYREEKLSEDEREAAKIFKLL